MRASKLISKASALMLGAAALALLVLMPLKLTRDYAQDLDDRLADALAARAKLQSIVQALEGIPETTTLDHTEKYAGDFLKGEQDSLILAELQTRLRAIVVGKNSELATARTLPPKAIGSQQYLGLRLQVHGELPDVQGILHSIEYGRPVLFIDRFTMRLLERRGATLDDRPPQLFAEIDVYGAKWPEQPARKTGVNK